MGCDGSNRDRQPKEFLTRAQTVNRDLSSDRGNAFFLFLRLLLLLLLLILPQLYDVLVKPTHKKDRRGECEFPTAAIHLANKMLVATSTSHNDFHQVGAIRFCFPACSIESIQPKQVPEFPLSCYRARKATVFVCGRVEVAVVAALLLLYQVLVTMRPMAVPIQAPLTSGSAHEMLLRKDAVPAAVQSLELKAWQDLPTEGTPSKRLWAEAAVFVLGAALKIAAEKQ